jgi:hypothetical protein
MVDARPGDTARARAALDLVNRNEAARAAFARAYDGPGEAVGVLRQWLVRAEDDPSRKADRAHHEQLARIAFAAPKSRAEQKAADEALAVLHDEQVRRVAEAQGIARGLDALDALAASATAARASAHPAPEAEAEAEAGGGEFIEADPAPGRWGARGLRLRRIVAGAAGGAVVVVAIVVAVAAFAGQSNPSAQAIRAASFAHDTAGSGASGDQGWFALGLPDPDATADVPSDPYPGVSYPSADWRTRPQNDADKLGDTSILTVTGSDVDPTTLRLIGEFGGWQVRLGLASTDRVCLVATRLTGKEGGVDCAASADEPDLVLGFSSLPTDSGQVAVRWDGQALAVAPVNHDGSPAIVAPTTPIPSLAP